MLLTESAVLTLLWRAGSTLCAIHCYHGFGSNTFSWSSVEQLLAERCQAQVTSHDMPAFGLTQRFVQLPGQDLRSSICI